MLSWNLEPVSSPARSHDLEGEMKDAESRIRSAEQMLELYPDGTHVVFHRKPTEGEGAWTFDGEFLRALLRLARRGLACRCCAANPLTSMNEMKYDYDR
jgi:hypothetical protein